jgi:hypothetical protein
MVMRKAEGAGLAGLIKSEKSTTPPDQGSYEHLI